MSMKRCWIYLVALLFLASPCWGAPTETVFEDNFNGENGGTWAYNYTGFANWVVADGYVDLVTADHPGFEAFAGYGSFVDLDGSIMPGDPVDPDAGRLESMSLFTFETGYSYTLSFDLAGSPAYWEDVLNNTVTVSLGSIYSEVFTIDNLTAFQTYTHVFEVLSAVDAKLIFDHEGGDNSGILLDNVSITRTPVPIFSSIWLLGSGLVGLFGLTRRFKK